MKYKVVFHSENYSAIDYETDDRSQALEVANELEAQMRIAGERGFFYTIEDEDYVPYKPFNYYGEI